MGLAWLSRLGAMCRATAMFSGPWPVRRRARSSRKTTSKVHPVQVVLDVPVRTHGAGKGRGIELGGAEMASPLVLDAAIALGFAFNHADHGRVGEGGFAGVAPIGGQPTSWQTR